MTPRRTVLGAAALVVVAMTVLAVVVSASGPQHRDAASPAQRSRATVPPGSVDAGATNKGSEVIVSDDDPASTALPEGRVDGSAEGGPLVTAAPPRTARRAGALVAGFPEAVVPVVSGSSVRSSGVSPARGALQVSIVADSSRSPEDVQAFYRRALRALDFVESTVPAAAGAVASQFVRGDDHLVVTTSTQRRRTSYSVLGTLRTRAHD